jgi:hypothetical protein
MLHSFMKWHVQPEEKTYCGRSHYYGTDKCLLAILLLRRKLVRKRLRWLIPMTANQKTALVKWPNINMRSLHYNAANNLETQAWCSKRD